MSTETEDYFKVGQLVQTSISVGGKVQPMQKGRIVAVHSGYCEVDVMGLHGGAPWVQNHTNSSLTIIEPSGDEKAQAMVEAFKPLAEMGQKPVQTSEKITTNFTADLRELLAIYGAELQAEDHYQGYAECGSDIRMTVSCSGQYDKDGNPVREYTEINLGAYFK